MFRHWPWLLVAATLSTAAARSQSGAAPAPATPPRATTAAADTAPPLDALIADALARSPVLAAARAGVVARRELESPAGALPDPMLEAMLQNVGTQWTVGDEDMSMLGAEVRQGFPYPGKRGAARRVAAGETAEAAASPAALERQIASEASDPYARIWALARERETVAAAAELVDLLGETARSRYAAGQTEQEAVLKARIQALRLDEELQDLATRRDALVTELNRWLDRAGDAPLGA